MADLITIEPNFSHPTVYLTINKMDQFAGVKYIIGLSPETCELLDFLKMARTQMQEEAELRRKFPICDELYRQYQTAIALTRSGQNANL